MKKFVIATAVFGALSVLLNFYSEHKKPQQQRLTELEQAHAQIVKQQR
jgi:hypothetical protein